MVYTATQPLHTVLFPVILMGNKSNMIAHSIFTLILLLSLTCNADVLCNPREREALLQFKGGFQDPGRTLSTWKKSEDCCKWNGVGCHNSTGHVIKLDLSCNSFPCLKGAIRPSLFDLKYIEHLDLSQSDFKGSQIPSAIGSFKNLRFLNLSSAGFAGSIPHQLGNLSNLQVLDLSSLPFASKSDDTDWLAKLSFLRHLDLTFVDLGKASKLFEALNMLPLLSVIKLYGCGLTRIPSSLEPVNLTSLVTLDLSWNYCNSTFPHWLYNTTNLEYLRLRANYFSPIETFYLLSNHLCKLRSLDLSLNNRDGEITFSRYEGQLVGCIKHSLEALDFFGNNITGTLPDFLEDLHNITSIRFPFNSLSGHIPAFIGNMSSLQILDLRRNRLNGTIPVSLGRLMSMRELILSSNRLNGEIPTNLGNLMSLEMLDLARNKFVGVIPSSFGTLKSLLVLDLSSNELVGNIPKCLGQLTNLKGLYLDHNNLKDLISEKYFSKLGNLKSLSLSNNYITLDIERNWVPPFSLTYLGMSSCIVGPTFPSWIKTQYQLTSLQLSNSSISGELPKWLWNFHMQNVDLSCNEFNGTLPTLLRNLTWDVINLSSNLLEGQLPQFSKSQYVQWLMLSNNSFSGMIPESICELIELKGLDLSKNNLHGAIPQCIKKMTSLEYLELSNNNFSGTITSLFQPSCSAKKVFLRNNRFSGVIPSSLTNCMEIITLDFHNNNFTGIVPLWLSNLKSLVFLFFGSNKLHGNIPPGLVGLTNLHILDLSNNDLSGSIPHTFGNFNSMQVSSAESDDYHFIIDIDIGGVGFVYTGLDKSIITVILKGENIDYTNFYHLVKAIDLSGNKLSGEIPEELGNLHCLVSLNLSRNQLTGGIPYGFRGMKYITSLDLSQNDLSGEIPQIMIQLTFLAYLNLSYNNLNGSIPIEGQFSTFSNMSYIGNTLLYGYPLEKCKVTEMSPFPSKQSVETSSNGYYDMFYLYVGITIGFIVGFWMIWGILLFNTSCKHSCFYFVDKIYIKTFTGMLLPRRHI